MSKRKRAHAAWGWAAALLTGAFLAGALLAGALLAGTLLAGPAAPSPAPGADIEAETNEALNPAPGTDLDDVEPKAGPEEVDALWRSGDLVATLADAEEIEVARRLGEARGGHPVGSGASVAALVLVQNNFAAKNCEPPPASACPEACNSLLVTWALDDPALHPEGVFLRVNGVLQNGGLPLPPEVAGVRLSGVSPGRLRVRVEAVDDGSALEGAINILDEEPMDDPAGLACFEGPVTGEGTCRLFATLLRPARPPDFYLVFLDGRLVGEAPGEATKLIVSDETTAGTPCVALQSILVAEEAGSAFYRGCRVESCSVIACTGEPCNPPIDLSLCQRDYGPDAEDNAVVAVFHNPEGSYEGGIHGFAGGKPVGSVAGDSARVVFGGLPPGRHVIGLAGDCGEDGLSRTVEGAITLLTATPHRRPVRGRLRCYLDSKRAVHVSWESDDPSVFADVYRLADGVRRFVARVPGYYEKVSFAPAAGASDKDSVLVQFFALRDGMCYGSDFLRCELDGVEGVGPFLRGDCNQDGASLGSPTDAIFLLGFLFAGGTPPRCRAACDFDADGEVVGSPTDALYFLNFNFLGGPAMTDPLRECGYSARPEDERLGCASTEACGEG